ncbi:glyoxalase [Amycolatopsis rubida]|uniref:Glyoxalase n=1 Tax=Amycolatopsis rubida TaxID=112413 RepID=A0A1I5ZAP5_9PSEU|nr:MULTISPECIES: VOC family protein [Amycolatopsis]MYW90793.1 glyoxalase [Amycolatopsis rubida]NEC55776.1 glyoxalase [Amycolatopsis rubida]OAP26153.1 Glyoxalase/Bleomycin resistance protein/Dioxygenase superfamily protein [Amycolatopsis sp. M39]SFQ53485.1 Glyoxalase/Bleomycin resistance protein/Dioxygenase superfamily protein [Amycolatopsis rubida]
MTTPAPSIAELGHVGLRCHDVSRQLAFYAGVLGLTVTDHDERLGIWFLSARPDTEHHELLLAEGRDAPVGVKLIQQVSFRCARFEDILGFHRRFREHDVRLDMIVSHGNAIGVYFYDPEGNRCEVYWQTGLVARQPFVEHIDIETDPEELLDAIRTSVERHGATGFTEESYRAWTREQAMAADAAETKEARQ